MSALEREAVVLEPHGLITDRALWAVPDRNVELAYLSWRRHVKRTIDIAIVVLLLPVALPLMAIVAIAVRLGSPGAVLFRHNRVGRHGEMFEMLKFRTMYVDATDRLHLDPSLYAAYVDNDFKLPAGDDPRLVRFGRFMRATSLDELPQLFNVLRGHMSLVGPRPIVASELQCYGVHAEAYLETRPGITGRWQCDGRNHIRYPARAVLDAEYLATWSLRKDFLILIRTVPSVLRRHGSH